MTESGKKDRQSHDFNVFKTNTCAHVTNRHQTVLEGKTYHIIF